MKYGLKTWAISNHLAGQLVCDLNDDRSDAFAPKNLAGKPEEKRKWAVEQMKLTARAAANLGVKVVNGFTGSPIWHLLYSFPPVSAQQVEDGQQTLRARLLTGSRTVIDLEPEARYLINPGSVGQPRDREPRAAYAIYDENSRRVYLYRVPYRASSARRRIIQAGLPPVLGDRLLHGA